MEISYAGMSPPRIYPCESICSYAVMRPVALCGVASDLKIACRYAIHLHLVKCCPFHSTLTQAAVGVAYFLWPATTLIFYSVFRNSFEQKWIFAMPQACNVRIFNAGVAMRDFSTEWYVYSVFVNV